MKTVNLSMPKFGFIVATRGALALGIGLLIAERIDRGKRRTVGRALVAAGALATVPAAVFVLRGFRPHQS